MEAGVWYVNTFLNNFFHRIILIADKDKQTQYTNKNNHVNTMKWKHFLQTCRFMWSVYIGFSLQRIVSIPQEIDLLIQKD